MTANMHTTAGKAVETTSIDFASTSSEELVSGKTINVKCIGLSMYPLIKYKDILVIQPATARDLRTGTVVFFKLSSGAYMVHRLIRKTGENTLLTNGDSLRNTDEPVRPEQILGKVSKVIHKGKTLSLEGKCNKFIGWLIVRLARYRIPLQITLKQNLARIQWLLCGKSVV